MSPPDDKERPLDRSLDLRAGTRLMEAVEENGTENVTGVVSATDPRP
jgi:hypothetical protein